MGRQSVVDRDRGKWTRDRKRLLEQIQQQVAIRTGTRHANSTYARQYLREFRGAWKESSDEALHRDLLQTQIVFGSDFHAFPQSQKTHLRILRTLSRRRVVLALECFEIQHQKWLDAYMKGRLSEEKLLEKTEWEDRWRFPFEHYRPLLVLARKRGYRVIAINEIHADRSERSLHARDRKAAKVLSQVWKLQAPELLYVIVGDFHLAESHLPGRTLDAIGRRGVRSLVIFQNQEDLYFRFSSRAMAKHPEVLKGPGTRYCILTSPPWVKWQSYLMYLEHAYDHDLEGPEIDPTDHVIALARVLAEDFNVNIRESEIAVYSLESYSFSGRCRQRLREFEQKAVSHLVANDQSFLLPSMQSAYLSRLSVNHAANLAGQFVHAQISRRTENHLRFPQDFLPQIWIEGVGFFMSKLLNPKRKSETLQSLKLQAQNQMEMKFSRGALMRALDQRMSELVAFNLGRLRPPKKRRSSLGCDLEATRILGHMLGERIFIAFEEGRQSIEDLKQLFRVSLDINRFTDFYYETIRRFEP